MFAQTNPILAHLEIITAQLTRRWASVICLISYWLSFSQSAFTHAMWYVIVHIFLRWIHSIYVLIQIPLQTSFAHPFNQYPTLKLQTMKWIRTDLGLQIEFSARYQTIFVQSQVLDYHGVWTLRLKMTEVLRECYSHAHDVLIWENERRGMIKNQTVASCISPRHPWVDYFAHFSSGCIKACGRRFGDHLWMGVMLAIQQYKTAADWNQCHICCGIFTYDWVSLSE